MSPAQKTEGSFVTLKGKFVLCMFIKKRHFQDRFCVFILSVRVCATVGPLKAAVCACVYRVEAAGGGGGEGEERKRVQVVGLCVCSCVKMKTSVIQRGPNGNKRVGLLACD